MKFKRYSSIDNYSNIYITNFKEHCAHDIDAYVRDFIDDLNDEFKLYITENRVISVFSKEGKMQNIKELSKYIVLVLNDAIEDFNKDHPEVKKIEKKELKRIYNVGKSLANLLIDYYKRC